MVYTEIWYCFFTHGWYRYSVKPRRWTYPQLRRAAQHARSYRDLLLRVGLKPAGGNYSHIQRIIREQNIKLPKYQGTGWSRGLRGIGKPRIAIENILRKDSYFQSYKLKKRLWIAGLKKRKCELCGWSKFAPGGRLPLELDHINGDRYDNRLENLRILCPNCHSIQPTHRGLNITRH